MHARYYTGWIKVPNTVAFRRMNVREQKVIVLYLKGFLRILTHLPFVRNSRHRLM